MLTQEEIDALALGGPADDDGGDEPVPAEALVGVGAASMSTAPAAVSSPAPAASLAPPVALPAAPPAPAEASVATLSSPATQVNPAAFAPLSGGDGGGEAANIDLLLDVSMQVSVELGRTRLTIGELLALRAGSVIELDKLAGEPVDILVNGTRIARGEVVVVDEKFGVRVLEVVSRAKRIASMA